MLLFLLISSAGSLALFRPWVGIISYYLLAILGPQYIWWWNFQGLRVSYIVALSAIIGVLIQFFVSSTYAQSTLKNKLNIWVMLLWFCISCSYFLGPYVDQYSSSGLAPPQLFYLTNTIFFFYFLASLELNSVKKLFYLAVVLVLSTLYLTYWANNQYLSQNWSQFNMGRLMGPSSVDGGSIYRDENAFALLFVCGLPFVYYLGWEMRKKWLRWGLWATIPLGWHAIFLTGSRGGLVALGAVMISVLFLSNRKIFVLPMLIFFLFFYQWQAGDIMTERSQQITDYKGEGSAEMRLAAWTGGVRMIVDQPLFGVGLGSFITALPDYYDTNPRVAHNTFIQFAAESGVGAGLAYFVIVILFFKQSFYIRRWCNAAGIDDEKNRIYLYNNASTASFIGLTVCSLFLSLNTYELFFVLLIFNNALYRISVKKADHSPEKDAVWADIQRAA